MKPAVVFSSLLALAASALATTVAYDTAYDVGTASLTTVTCSGGENGLITRGYTTFNSLPKFPYIGAAYAVAGYNSPACGTCWSLTYNNGHVSNCINVTAIDHAGADSFNIALSAMNELTNNQAVALGRVTVTSEQIDPSYCGL